MLATGKIDDDNIHTDPICENKLIFFETQGAPPKKPEESKKVAKTGKIHF